MVSPDIINKTIMPDYLSPSRRIFFLQSCTWYILFH